jgi:hypothetical protein
MLKQALLVFFLITTPLIAQGPSLAVHNDAELKQHFAKLLEDAKKSPTGNGLLYIDNFGNYSTLLVARVHSGEAEQHDLWADQMIVLTGTITVITGGTIKDGHALPNQPGETRGPSIEGGKEIIMHPGDVAHIPATLPHWVKLAPNTTCTYIVFKEKT